MAESYEAAQRRVLLQRQADGISPKFGTFAWKMANFAANATNTAPEPAPVPILPVIESLQWSPSNILVPDSPILSWSAKDADNLNISIPGGNPENLFNQNLTGSASINFTQFGNFVAIATATSPNGTATLSATLTATLPNPVITNLSWAPPAVELPINTSVLTWSAINTASVNISIPNGIPSTLTNQSFSGSTPISFINQGTYVASITAFNLEGKRTITTASLTVLPQPIYSPIPNVIYVSGGDDPFISNRFYRRNDRFLPEVYYSSIIYDTTQLNSPFAGDVRAIRWGPYNASPLPPWDNWIIQKSSGSGVDPAGLYYINGGKAPVTLLPYVGLSGYDTTCGVFFPWVSGNTTRPNNFKPHCLRGFPDAYDQPWLPEEIRIEGVSSYPILNSGPPINLSALFVNSFVWNTLTRQYDSTDPNPPFGVAAVIRPPFSEINPVSAIAWRIYIGSTSVNWYTNNWPFCSFPCDETPFYNQDREFKDMFRWTPRRSDVPNISAIRIIRPSKPLPPLPPQQTWPCPPPPPPPIGGAGLAFYKLNV